MPQNVSGALRNSMASLFVNKSHLRVITGADDLYDRYAAIMYSVIYKFTGNEADSERIFSNAFLKLYSQKQPLIPGQSSYINVIKFTNKFLHEQIVTSKPIGSPAVKCPHFPIMNLLIHQSYTLENAAAFLELTVDEIKAGFTMELSMFRAGSECPKSQ
jgi:hypothetical protein